MEATEDRTHSCTTSCGLVKILDLASSLKVTFIHKHVTLNFVPVSLACISRACLASEWYENAYAALPSQLWALEASKLSGEGFVILWRPELRRTLGENTYA